MKEADKGWVMVRIGVSGCMFLLLLAHPGSLGQRAVKWLLLYSRCYFSKVCHMLSFVLSVL